MATSKELSIVYTRIFFVEIAYWIVSIGMVFVNEFVLSDNILTDDLTVFITIFQILFSLCILITLNYITKKYLITSATNDNLKQATVKLKNDSLSISVNTKLLDNQDWNEDHEISSETGEEKVLDYDDKSGAKKASKQTSQTKDNSDGLIQLLIVDIPNRISLETCKLVFPLSILYIGMLLLNNFCLKNVGVAFYFVSRSLTTVFNVIFTYFIIDEPVSRGALLCCAFIVLGFILGIDQESVIGSLSVIGVIFGVASSLFTSLFSIYTKKTLAKLDRNIWLLVLYNNINAVILCSPLLIVHGDVKALISDKVISPLFWTLLSISGVMAFFISIVTNASIKYTSPLTHNISGTAKACVQTVIAVIYYHDHKSTLWWISNVMILVASAAYSRIKQLEMERKSTCLPQEVDEKSINQSGAESQFKIVKQRRDSSSSGCSATSESCQRTQNDHCCSVKLQESV